jgi:hypothetical protein
MDASGRRNGKSSKMLVERNSGWNVKARMFFSEEKNQKTFNSPALPRSRPWPVGLRWRRCKSLLLLFFRKEDLSTQCGGGGDVGCGGFATGLGG